MPGHCQGQNGLQAYERHTKEEKAKIKKKIREYKNRQEQNWMTKKDKREYIKTSCKLHA